MIGANRGSVDNRPGADVHPRVRSVLALGARMIRLNGSYDRLENTDDGEHA
jgi:hypothetical protein